MKTIKKLKNNMKAVAGSALLVGATLTAGAAAVSAQSGSSGDLGDYPAPFVDDNGEVDTTVVVGETADDGEPVSTADVVSAVEIAGSLGNAAFQQTEQSVEVSGAAGWSATDGVTLNRENSNLYAYDPANAQISVAEAGDFNALQDVEFDNHNGDTVQAEYEVEASNVEQTFDSSARGLDDPALYADLSGRTRTNVAPGADKHVMNLRAEFNDNAIQFSHEDMDGEEIQLFGRTFTVDAEETRSEDALVLYGDSQTFSVNRGESNTITVDGNDHEFRVENVESGSATIRVDGNLRSVSSSDTVRVSGNDVRVRNIYNYQDGDGVVEFGVGSDELILEDGKSVERDGETVRGTHVSLEGGTVSSFNSNADDPADEVDAINVYVGPESRDDEALMPGDSYQDQVFGVAEFQYGGLNADAAQNPAEEVMVENSVDMSEITFTTDDGNELTQAFAYDSNTNSGDTLNLQADQDAEIATYEGEFVDLDDYLVLNVDERADMFQVTDVTESDVSDTNSDASVELENVETGNTIELEPSDFEDVGSPSEGATAEFRHNRQTYEAFVAEGGSEEVSITRKNTDQRAIFPAMYTETDHAVSFVEGSTTLDVPHQDDATSATGTLEVRLPSTKSSSDQVVTIYTDAGNSEIGLTDVSNPGSSDTVNVDVGGVSYDIAATTVTSNAGSGSVELTVTPTNPGLGSNSASTNGFGAMLMQPQDDNDQEEAFVFLPQEDQEGSDEVGSLTVEYTGAGTDFSSEDAWMTENDDDGDNTLGYTTYGTYTEQDIDSDQESFTASLVGAQSTSGFALTGAGGELSASGSSSGSVETASPTYERPDAALDTDSDIGQTKNSQENLILVGGPSVNSLVQELVDDGQTMAASEYTEGQGMIQMVDGWTDGQSALVVAGHSGEDTRAAGEFLADYRDHQSDLEGRSEVTISTETGSVVQ